MSLSLLAAIVALVLWITLIFVVHLGPAGVVFHLLLGASAVLFIRWWALRIPPSQ